MNKIFRICKNISDSKSFNYIITLTILFAGILIGLETYPSLVENYYITFDILENIILIIFILEIIIKVLKEAKQPWKYFYDGWNVFDFTIVVSVFLPFGGSSMAVLRLLRLLRILRLVKTLPKLQLLVNALMKTITSMGYITLLLLLLTYICIRIGWSNFF